MVSDTDYIKVKCQGNDFWHDLEIVKSCIGRTYDEKTKYWIVPAIKSNIDKLKNIHYLQKHLSNFEKIQKSSTVDLAKESAVIKKQFPFLYDYQAIASYLALNKKRFLVADDMGLGKSVEMMPVIKKGHDDKKIIILLAPSSLLRQWNSEIKRFINLEGYIIQGTTKPKRISAYAENNIILTTYESFWRDYKSIKIDWSNVIIIADEASKFKNRKTKIWEALKEVCEHADMFIALTGTPVENSLINFFNILEVIKPNFMSSKEFFNNYCDWEKSTFGSKIVGYKNLDGFLQRVSNIMIRRKKSDFDDLPEKQIINRFIPLTKGQKYCADEIRRFCGEEDSVQSLVLLREVANDTELLINTAERTSIIDIMRKKGYFKKGIPSESNKLIELSDIMEEIGDQRIIIFTMFSTSAFKIGKYLNDNNYKVRILTGKDSMEKRDKTIEEHKKNEFQILVATDIFGYGVNLQYTDILINYDLPWNPAKLAQRNDRIHRRGSKNDKTIINFISEDIEEKVKEVVDAKQCIFDQVVNGEAIDDEEIRNVILKKLL